MPRTSRPIVSWPPGARRSRSPSERRATAARSCRWYATRRADVLPPRGVARRLGAREPVAAGSRERPALLAGEPPPGRVLPVGRVDDGLPRVVATGRRPPRGLRGLQSRAGCPAGSCPCHERRSKASSSWASSDAIAGSRVMSPSSAGLRARAPRPRRLQHGTGRGTALERRRDRGAAPPRRPRRPPSGDRRPGAREPSPTRVGASAGASRAASSSARDAPRPAGPRAKRSTRPRRCHVTRVPAARAGRSRGAARPGRPSARGPTRCFARISRTGPRRVRADPEGERRAAGGDALLEALALAPPRLLARGGRLAARGRAPGAPARPPHGGRDAPGPRPTAARALAEAGASPRPSSPPGGDESSTADGLGRLAHRAPPSDLPECHNRSVAPPVQGRSSCRSLSGRDVPSGSSSRAPPRRSPPTSSRASRRRISSTARCARFSTTTCRCPATPAARSPPAASWRASSSTRRTTTLGAARPRGRRHRLLRGRPQGDGSLLDVGAARRARPRGPPVAPAGGRGATACASRTCSASAATRRARRRCSGSSGRRPSTVIPRRRRRSSSSRPAPPASASRARSASPSPRASTTGGRRPRVHVVEGEGGLTPGRVAEALAAAGTASLDNLVVHVDWNQASIDSNRVCREDGQPGDYVQWTPMELFYLHDWNVDRGAGRARLPAGDRGAAAWRRR